MITLLTGDNAFEIERTLARLVSEFDGEAERVDGARLELRQLPDLLMGVSLFAAKRLVIIKDLSESKEVWSVFGDWLERVSSDIDLVLVEPKLDKRMATYKALKKSVQTLEFPEWSDHDTGKATDWVIDEAQQLGVKLDKKSAQLVVARVGINQWQLYNAVQKLSLVDTVTPAVIEDVIEASPTENVFNLFDAALSGDRVKLRAMLSVLEQSEDPFRLLALLSGQAFQLAAVVVSSSADDTAKDFGIHPYAVSKLKSSANKLGRGGARKIIKIFAAADDDMKLSRAEPWLLIERALQQVASI